jgi:hypothetical protein
MKRLAIAFIVFGALSCSKENQIITPSSKNSLSMVIPNSNGQSISGNLLLLTDGRRANPVSGIPDFNTLKVGDKLSLSFREGETKNNVVDIIVTRFAGAKDSVFVPLPTNSDTVSFSGKFIGYVYKRKSQIDSSSTDTTRVPVDAFTLSFKGSNYTCSGSSIGYPGAGNGTFSVSHDELSSLGTITFSDTNSKSGIVLDRTFNYYMPDANHINIYVNESDWANYDFYLRRDVPTQSPTNSSDSLAITGRYKGGFTKIYGADSVTYPAQISFSGNNYSIAFSYPDSTSAQVNGTFTATKTTIDFLNWQLFSSDENHVLMNSNLSDNRLYLWTTKNGEYFRFTLTKN